MDNSGNLLPSATNDYLSIRKFEKYALGYDFVKRSGNLTFSIYDNNLKGIYKTVGVVNYYKSHTPHFRLFRILENGCSDISFTDREKFIEFFFEKDISLGFWMLANL